MPIPTDRPHDGGDRAHPSADPSGAVDQVRTRYRFSEASRFRSALRARTATADDGLVRAVASDVTGGRVPPARVTTHVPALPVPAGTRTLDSV